MYYNTKVNVSKTSTKCNFVKVFNKMPIILLVRTKIETRDRRLLWANAHSYRNLEIKRQKLFHSRIITCTQTSHWSRYSTKNKH